MKLYYAPGACSLASHIVLEEAGADYEAVKINLKEGEQRTPAYLAINPKGRVPALATDKGILTESPTIMAYIAQTFPDAKLVDLHDPFAFAAIQAFNIFLTSSVHVTFAHVRRPTRYADGEVAAAAMKAKAAPALDDAFGLIEDKLKQGPWVHGADYTISDPYLFVFTRWFNTDGLGHPERFPNVQAHHARMLTRPAVQRTLELEASA